MATASVEQKRPRPAWLRILIWVVSLAVAGAFAHLVGWDIRGWFHDLWETVKTISTAHLIAGIVCMIIQTSMAAFAWYSIVHYAYPKRTKWKDILAAYAVSVGLNGILPANLGTLIFMIMLTVLVGMSFSAVLGGYAVQKIFFTLAGTFVYLYLFITVGGSFDIKFGWIRENPVTSIVLFGGGALLIMMLVRRFWPKVVKWWEGAKEGGAVLGSPGTYFGRVFLPSLVSWLAGLAVIGVFLSAYKIPVSFDTIMHVAGGNSLANVTSFTPGGVGVTQAWNVASLQHVEGVSSDQATAYSVAQQLVCTAWSILFALILLIWAWGWSGGKQLVSDSYAEAKRRQQEETEKRRTKKEAGAADKAAQ